MRVLPADVYDTLELSAWIFGGIGAGSLDDAAGNPLCLLGHLEWLEPYPSEEYVLHKARARVKLFVTTNDNAVQAINTRHGNAPNARVPFGKWCKELDVVRGES